MSNKNMKQRTKPTKFVEYVESWYLSQLENDKKSPTLDLLFRVCKAIGVKASTIVARVERGQADSD